jgi:Undecaprenyl-phosphate glucose phosphotransferase
MKSRTTELILIYLFIDLCLLNSAIFLTGWINRSGLFLSSNDITGYFVNANLSWLITFFAFSKKNLYLRDGFYNRFKRITKRISVFLVISIVFGFLVMPNLFQRKYFLEFALLYYIIKILFYWGLYSYLKFKRSKGFHISRVLIVGINDTCQYLREMIEHNPILGYDFVGFVTSKTTDDPYVLGKTDDLKELIQEHQVQMVFIISHLFENEDMKDEFMKICNCSGVRIRLIPDDNKWVNSHLNTESVGDLSLINPQEIPLDRYEARFIKRLLDLLFSGLFMVLVFSWLYPILAILIKLSSKGPVLFVQQRTCINNKTFNCYKFRSMRINKYADTMQATANDCRITAIGKFMRRTNIDELPQFINVFFGQMSVVGPRPHMLMHTEQYSRLIEYYQVRHYVKPGVTGWAQVNGYRGETKELWKMQKRVEFDMAYIENWSLWWDIKIVFWTVFDKKTYVNAG